MSIRPFFQPCESAVAAWAAWQAGHQAASTMRGRCSNRVVVACRALGTQACRFEVLQFSRHPFNRRSATDRSYVTSVHERAFRLPKAFAPLLHSGGCVTT